MKVYHRTCQTCNGTGQVELEPGLARVIRLISVSGKTTPFISDKLGLTLPATNNRLRKLMDYGLVTRKRLDCEGRLFIYRKVPGRG